MSSVQQAVRCPPRESTMCSAKLREFLDKNQIKYVLITHSTAYTLRKSRVVHIKGKELAKSVIVKLDDVMAMASFLHPCTLTCATARGNRSQGNRSGFRTEFKSKFPDCELGDAAVEISTAWRSTPTRASRRQGDRIQRRLAHELIRLPFADLSGLRAYDAEVRHRSGTAAAG